MKSSHESATSAAPESAKQGVAAASPFINWQPWLWGAGLVLLVLAVYWPTLRNGFIWDDDAYVERNVALRSSEGLHDMWLKWGAIPQYYPLVHTTFWVEFHLWGLKPLGYHVVNMLLHAASAVLLWRVLLRLSLPGAWLAAAIFAVHPVCVESVAWVAERKNVLSLALALGSILAYLRYEPPESAPGDKRVNPGWDYELALVLYIGALLSKSVTATLPAVLAVIYWWKRGRLTRHELSGLGPWFVFGVGMSIITIWLEKALVGAEGGEWDFSPIDRVLIAGRALWFYAGKLCWPYPLIFFYPRWTIDASVWWQYLYPAAALATIAVLWLKRDRIGRGPLAAVLIFAGVLVPALGFFNVYPFRYSFVADHFQYHATVALIALFAAGATTAARRLLAKPEWLAAAAAAVLLAPLAVLAHRETYVYENLATLYNDILVKNPESWLAHINLGTYLEMTGKNQEAVEHFREGIRLLPKSEWHRANLGHVLEVTGQVDEGIAQINSSLEGEMTDRERASALMRLADLLTLKQRYDEAIEHFETALALCSDDSQIYSHYGNTLANKGEDEKAVEMLEKALELNPSAAEVYFKLGLLSEKARKFPEALEHLQNAALLNPTAVATLEELARVAFVVGDMPTAQRAIAQAHAIAPESHSVRNLVGVFLLRHGKFPEAIFMFESILNEDPKNAQATVGLQRAREAMEQAQGPQPTNPGQPAAPGIPGQPPAVPAQLPGAAEKAQPAATPSAPPGPAATEQPAPADTPAAAAPPK